MHFSWRLGSHLCPRAQQRWNEGLGGARRRHVRGRGSSAVNGWRDVRHRPDRLRARVKFHENATENRVTQRSSGVSPVVFAIFDSITGPISSPSWNANTTGDHPSRTRRRWDLSGARRSTRCVAARRVRDSLWLSGIPALRGRVDHERERHEGARVPLTVRDFIGKNGERKRLRFGERIGLRRSVSVGTRKLAHRGDPTTIDLSFEFHGERERHKKHDSTQRDARREAQSRGARGPWSSSASAIRTSHSLTCAATAIAVNLIPSEGAPAWDVNSPGGMQCVSEHPARQLAAK